MYSERGDLKEAGFPHSETCGSAPICRLPAAYRRLSRPSSPVIAKASTTCTYSLDPITLPPPTSRPPRAKSPKHSQSHRNSHACASATLQTTKVTDTMQYITQCPRLKERHHNAPLDKNNFTFYPKLLKSSRFRT